MIDVFTGKRYSVSSIGNGLAAEIKRLSDGYSVFMQGEEASDFLDELDAAIEGRRDGGDGLCSDYDHLMQASQD